MVRFEDLNVGTEQTVACRQLGLTERALVAFVKAIPLCNQRFKIRYFQAFLDFLDILSLGLIEKNGLVQSLKDGMPRKQEERITRLFLSMLEAYGLIELREESYVFQNPYSSLAENDFQQIVESVDQPQKSNSELPEFLLQKLNNYRIVNKLILLYRNPEHQVVGIPSEKHWRSLIAGQQLDYEIRLAETLKHLWQLELPKKIHSALDDSYYTESGRNAFRNFTKNRFLTCVDHIDSRNPIREVLDIGCGYGNYMDALSRHLPEVQICGVELQEKVYRETEERFAGNDRVSVLNSNVFDVKPGKPVDLVLMNYVLFYFSNEQKERLFTKLHEVLSDTGSILICQYYAGIEDLKDQLKQHQGDAGLAKRVAAFYGDKILYANSLWNEASDAFVQAEIWDEFLQLLNKTGFRVEALTHADPFYYSLFVEIKKV
ncbi:class I SAM-dependent methyltransferase [Mangrovibacterium diazotrophicum]|uniref:Methyltransferase family protein n=1 Tax=Mangrovibacterium diazotrophicum TaxID=1261403 RepID=A0A419W8G1_9BACT|nr:class I SAM-dependent methyltransferase [Mangrovibacterium diazotrophicum]RKD91738.1 methyltransferase family protein [Mangrovibacterium diazotrophicum]